MKILQNGERRENLHIAHKKEQREIRKLHSIGNAFYLDFNVGEE